MPLFLSDEEFERCSSDAWLVAERADSFIRDLYRQIEIVKAQADASTITAEQTCALLEQKYISLSDDFSRFESQNAQLSASLEQRLAELSEAQAEKHQLHLQTVTDRSHFSSSPSSSLSIFVDWFRFRLWFQISLDGDVERLKLEVAEHQKSKRQLLELVEQKDIEIAEKNATIKCYLDKIVCISSSSSAAASFNF